MPTHRLAIFASGTGSNARKIIEYFAQNPDIRVELVVCNRPHAGVLAVAKEYDVPALLIEKERFFNGDAYIGELKRRNISLLVLAGFLWKIPPALVAAYPGGIINLHPALLPKYGGKGMYGNRVHEAVIGAGEKESGITIHYVNDQYDEGAPLFQASCAVLEGDTPGSLAERIHALEHEHYAKVIEGLLKEKDRG